MSHFTIKQGDNFPPIRAQLEQDDLSAVSLGEATVRFLMTTHHEKVQIQGTAEVVDAQNGIVQYQWQDGDTAVHGNYKGEFEVRFSDGRTTTVPAENYIIVSVTKQAE